MKHYNRHTLWLHDRLITRHAGSSYKHRGLHRIAVELDNIIGMNVHQVEIPGEVFIEGNHIWVPHLRQGLDFILVHQRIDLRLDDHRRTHALDPERHPTTAVQ